MSDKASGAPDYLHFNGINAASGEYLIPPKTTKGIARIAQGEKPDESHLKELLGKQKERVIGEHVLGPKEGADAKDLSQTGWGAIFPANGDPRIREALSELLDHRKRQATKRCEHYYQEYAGERGYLPGETKSDFFQRHEVGRGPADPDKMPYYLLIVGDPEQIPYSFQYQLDVQYAVGRIHFETMEEYARYARSVVDAESGKVALPRRAVFFGVENEDDRATHFSTEGLVSPLSTMIAEDQPAWDVATMLREQTSKSRLGEFMGGDKTPSLLFTASHGLGFPVNDPRQLRHQGALLCRDWPGPDDWQAPIPESFYFSGDDISSDARLLGSVTFHFACYGAGTPRLDDFAHIAFQAPSVIAPRAFVSYLPQRLLGHPKGGALAAIGHVERAWGYSFMWERQVSQVEVFRSALKRLMEGHPVGSAIECFNERYAELSTELTAELEKMGYGRRINDKTLAALWTANNDARSYAIVGDPAVRLPLSEDREAKAERPTIETITVDLNLTARVPETDSDSLPSPEPAIDYGLLDPLKQARTQLTGALKGLAEKLGETLDKTMHDITSMEVRTYVSNNMSDVKYESGQLTGAKLLALTQVSLDGDTKVCVPERDGELDEFLWAIHSEMVKTAQAHRAELLRTVISAATGLLDALKGG